MPFKVDKMEETEMDPPAETIVEDRKDSQNTKVRGQNILHKFCCLYL